MRNWAIRLGMAVLILFSANLFAQQNSAPKKYALVIGNGNYTSFGSLKNAVNDANEMAKVLQGLGFTVDKVLNGSRVDMVNGATRLKDHLLSAGNNTYGFFYYAGHGVQVDGVNYLIPANASIPDKDFLPELAVSAQTVLNMLNSSNNALNIVVLDACRDFPAAWVRSADRGLAVMNPPTDSIIMYATAAGKTAADGTGSNGLFTTHLLNNLKTPGIEVTDAFRRTMRDVADASHNQQRPAMYTDFAKVAYLGPTDYVETRMVRINGGTFSMGSPASEPDRYDDEGPQHQVTVSGFYMGKYPVTQKEYQSVMGTNPSDSRGDNLPVESITWYDAIEYCNALSRREGLSPAYTVNGSNVTWNRNANGYRLPTEAEWEYACRAGTTSAYSSGTAMSNNIGWHSANSDKTTHPVGQRAANAWGLYDMHGNICEWCWDWLGGYSSGAQNNPMGASSGSERIVRGGCYNRSTGYIRSASRDSYNPSQQKYCIGFRLVRNGQ